MKTVKIEQKIFERRMYCIALSDGNMIAFNHLRTFLEKEDNSDIREKLAPLVAKYGANYGEQMLQFILTGEFPSESGIDNQLRTGCTSYTLQPWFHSRSIRKEKKLLSNDYSMEDSDRKNRQDV